MRTIVAIIMPETKEKAVTDFRNVYMLKCEFRLQKFKNACRNYVHSGMDCTFPISVSFYRHHLYSAWDKNLLLHQANTPTKSHEPVSLTATKQAHALLLKLIPYSNLLVSSV